MWLGTLLLLDAKGRVLVRAPFAASGTIYAARSAKIAPSEACGTGAPATYVVEYEGKALLRGPASQVFQGSIINAGWRVEFERFEFAPSES